MLSSLFISPTVSAVREALESAAVAGGAVIVLEQPRLGRALADGGHRVLYIADRPRSLRRAGSDRLCSEPGALPLAGAGAAAVVARGLGQREDWHQVLTEWSRVVRDRGAIVLIDRPPATELTRRALCGGLGGIEQRQVGRTIVTSGRVHKLD